MRRRADDLNDALRSAAERGCGGALVAQDALDAVRLGAEQLELVLHRLALHRATG